MNRLFLSDATNGGITIREQYLAECGKNKGKFVDLCTHTTSIKLAKEKLNEAKIEGYEIFNHSLKVM